jgi:hypothetical protein
MRIVRRKVMSIFLIGFLFYACSDIDRNRSNLYSMDSLLRKQSEFLVERTADLTKITSLGYTGDTVKIIPKNSTEWVNELEIFGVIDVLNKPANRDFYKIENYPDNKSNLRVKAFTAMEDLPVKYLRLYYHETEEKIRMIEAKYDESNLLYGSNRLFTMKFEPIDDAAILTSYEIVGNQKMFLGDSVKYTISGSVALSN